MQKSSYNSVKNNDHIQFTDLRDQHAFQEGHLKGALNLNIKNYGKYSDELIKKNHEIVLIVDENSTQLLDEFEEKFGSENVSGYLVNEEISKEDKEAIETVSPKEFLENEEDYILLDVRHPDEITRPAPEKNLVNIPLEDLNTHLNDLDQSKDIYTLCGSGNRATTTASYLVAHNFNPTVIEGGMKGIEEYKKD